MRDSETGTLGSIRYQVGTDIARRYADFEIDNLFVVPAHKRSGHHAVIDWILSQFTGTRVHYNFANKGCSGDLVGRCDSAWTSDYGLTTDSIRAASINYENHPLTSTPAITRMLEECNRTFPRARSRYLLSLVRDAYNNFASCVLRRPGCWSTTTWLGHARFFLDETTTSFRGFRVIRIPFNAWFASGQFRRRLADDLGVDVFLPHQARVSHFGGGSTFDALELDGRAAEMKVLERWKLLSGQLVGDLFENSETSIKNLNEAIFGPDFASPVHKELSRRLKQRQMRPRGF